MPLTDYEGVRLVHYLSGDPIYIISPRISEPSAGNMQPANDAAAEVPKHLGLAVTAITVDDCFDVKQLKDPNYLKGLGVADGQAVRINGAHEGELILTSKGVEEVGTNISDETVAEQGIKLIESRGGNPELAYWASGQVAHRAKWGKTKDPVYRQRRIYDRIRKKLGTFPPRKSRQKVTAVAS
jgi:hypothetical protein